MSWVTDSCHGAVGPGILSLGHNHDTWKSRASNEMPGGAWPGSGCPNGKKLPHSLPFTPASQALISHVSTPIAQHKAHNSACSHPRHLSTLCTVMGDMTLTSTVDAAMQQVNSLSVRSHCHSQPRYVHQTMDYEWPHTISCSQVSHGQVELLIRLEQGRPLGAHSHSRHAVGRLVRCDALGSMRSFGQSWLMPRGQRLPFVNTCSSGRPQASRDVSDMPGQWWNAQALTALPAPVTSKSMPHSKAWSHSSVHATFSESFRPLGCTDDRTQGAQPTL